MESDTTTNGEGKNNFDFGVEHQPLNTNDAGGGEETTQFLIKQKDVEIKKQEKNKKEKRCEKQ